MNKKLRPLGPFYKNRFLKLFFTTLIAGGLWTGCSTNPKTDDTQTKVESTGVTSNAASNTSANSSTSNSLSNSTSANANAIAPAVDVSSESGKGIAKSEEVKVELQKISQIQTEALPADAHAMAPSHSAHAPAAASSHHDASAGVEPEKSLGWLKNGNTRYRKGFLRKDGQAKKDIERLSTGQKPHAIVLSCSDSRVPPEIVFDQKLGEIFVVRTAGEALDANVIGSIEYAVEHLGSRLIVVMGHTSCGAVKAAMGTINGGDAGSPALNHLVADIHPRLQSFKNSTPTKDVQPESWANAKGVARDLVAQSKILSEKIRSGEVKIVSALYHLGSGEVQFAE